MSEYQFYEFQAIDRPLDAAARAELREVSSRAQITASSFSVEYNYGDLKADPLALLAEHFDLYFYTGFWSSRQFAMRVPARLIDRDTIARFGIDREFLDIRDSNDDLLIDISRIEMELAASDDSHWLAALAPLRAAVMGGDLRLFYLLWLMQVGFEMVEDDVAEPLPGLAPLDGALAAFADFLDIDPHLVAAAAEQGAPAQEPDDAAVDAFLRSLGAEEQHAILRHVYAGDAPHLGTELRRRCRTAGRCADMDAEPRRTAQALRQRAQQLADAADAARRRQEAAARQRKADAEAKAQAARLARLAGREAEAWRKVELLIEQRNRNGYREAVELLTDLRALLAEREFATRLDTLRVRHNSKRTFIAQLDDAGLKPAGLRMGG